MAKRLILLCLILSLQPAGATADVGRQRQEQLRHLLKHDCGSCHGMTLKGGLGPALTPAMLANKPKGLLEYTILSGRPGTPMPPWGIFLSKEEVSWLVDRLLSGEFVDE